MPLLRSIATVGAMTMISRVLGFVRDMLVAATLGAGWMADAFFVAFKLPNLFRRLFAEGAFNLAFVPLFAGKLEGEGEAAAKTFAEEAFSVLFWSLAGFVAVGELAMGGVVTVFAPGFVSEPEKFQLAVDLARITFPYLFFISLVSLLAGMLNSAGKFAAPAATPILLNITLIAAIFGISPWAPSPAYALSIGVFMAGAIQLGWLAIHARRAGMGLRLVRPRLSADVRLLARRIAPVAVGAGIYQLNLLVDTVIASLLPSGAISYLFYADRVNQLPLGVVGVAVGTALLPLLSRQIRAGHDGAARHAQNRAIEFALLLTLPAACALVALAHPVIVVLFERGAFGALQAQATAQALAVFAAGLPAYVLVKTLAPGFFAREDTKTPIKIGIFALGVNVALNLWLMGPLAHVGIALATVVSAWVNAGLLGGVLMMRGHLDFDRRLARFLPRAIAASVVMVLVLLVTLWGLNVWGAGDWLHGGQLGRIGGLAALVGAGLLSYALAAQVFGAADLRDLKRMLGGGKSASAGKTPDA
ncbi:murein biosynthesis integral membrane protein MurJ [Varunaivibrio sulfuroxidans]|uniref:Probable lipid II flippase MurJ n=1 Tax=Varunaivibrio sulfuroxidans TaxID=1773489 RepID=A0A4R3JFM3_9PROT|nr:murein biosynthesis integral membrane protein MurJ [Varunaivibrio sulfuroxidans]TCS64928.1 putative peptidoglycan lipid II flippase [Varunaivibrio sulfuroxidans]WES29780.1 murein biosynthesis integral membrane protein MurJ [Varunaivibrio sulfuroxidans]